MIFYEKYDGKWQNERLERSFEVSDVAWQALMKDAMEQKTISKYTNEKMILEKLASSDFEVEEEKKEVEEGEGDTDENLKCERCLGDPRKECAACHLECPRCRETYSRLDKRGCPNC